MNLPGHTGLTLGAFLAAGYVGDVLVYHSYRAQSSRRRWIRFLGAFFGAPPEILRRLRLDYRVVLAGALLPDIIDKPLGLFLLSGLLDTNGRTIGHTLAFNLLLLVMGLLVYKSRGNFATLLLAVSSAGHLILDQMWQNPQTLLWPLLGWGFPPGVPDLNNWIMYQLTLQWLSIPEVIGLLVLVWFATQIYRLRAILQFVKTGNVDIAIGIGSGRGPVGN